MLYLVLNFLHLKIILFIYYITYCIILIKVNHLVITSLQLLWFSCKQISIILQNDDVFILSINLVLQTYNFSNYLIHYLNKQFLLLIQLLILIFKWKYLEKQHLHHLSYRNNSMLKDSMFSSDCIDCSLYLINFPLSLWRINEFGWWI